MSEVVAKRRGTPVMVVADPIVMAQPHQADCAWASSINVALLSRGTARHCHSVEAGFAWQNDVDRDHRR